MFSFSGITTFWECFLGTLQRQQLKWLEKFSNILTHRHQTNRQFEINKLKTNKIERRRKQAAISLRSFSVQERLSICFRNGLSSHKKKAETLDLHKILSGSKFDDKRARVTFLSACGRQKQKNKSESKIEMSSFWMENATEYNGSINNDAFYMNIKK